ncbi:MAG: amino acid permease, partial [Planctomycetes bacterium]|nr:amino acid permease [Planctomycetota bacterium]
VFFPAVTGIAVGASMSGDLKDPGKNIPRGTLASIVFTAIIYFAATYWIGVNVSQDDLVNKKMAMRDIAIWGDLIILGVWAATLSSALGSVMAAPRTLQALAYDRVMPRFVASQLGSKTEPRVAVIVTTTIAVTIIWMGDLEAVATILTMFFLNSYGIINLSAGLEKLVGNPSYRPKFNIHWSLSLLGALGCYSAMLLITVPFTLLVIAISFFVFVLLERRKMKTDFGDVRSGLWFSVARHSLLRLEDKEQEIKNWRPNVIVFAGQTQKREYLCDMGEWLAKGKGIVSFVQLIAGNTSELAGSGLRDAGRRQMRAALKERGISGFADCHIVSDFDGGALSVAQSYGVSGLEPNTVLMGYAKSEARHQAQFKLVRTLADLKKSVLILKYDPVKEFGNQSKIDIWWSGRSRNGELMLMLAHIISRHKSWDGAKIRVLQIVRNEDQAGHTEDNLKRTLENVRVRGEVKAVIPESGSSIAETIAAASADADLTIVGMRMPENTDIPAMAAATDELVRQLGSVLLVRSAEVEDLLGN